jgi:D-tyrosyl-tRNA(Tyr) deacylase
MRGVIQRVQSAKVIVENEVSGKIDHGLLVFIGIEERDNNDDAEWLAKKIGALRIFSDDEGLMNLSVNDVSGSILVVSQFTLHAKTKKGTRPSFIRAAKPEQAVPLYEKFKLLLETEVKGSLESGEFGAHMDVQLINDGPVTIIIDTQNKE